MRGSVKSWPACVNPNTGHITGVKIQEDLGHCGANNIFGFLKANVPGNE
jgi:hypothetical protein